MDFAKPGQPSFRLAEGIDVRKSDAAEARRQRIWVILDALKDNSLSDFHHVCLEMELHRLGQASDASGSGAITLGFYENRQGTHVPDFRALYRRKAELDRRLFGIDYSIQPRGPWLRYSLRTMFAVVTAMCIVAGFSWHIVVVFAAALVAIAGIGLGCFFGFAWVTRLFVPTQSAERIVAAQWSCGQQHAFWTRPEIQPASCVAPAK